jgi:hypothetical protein
MCCSILPFSLFQMGMHASPAGPSLDGHALLWQVNRIREEPPFRLLGELSFNSSGGSPLFTFISTTQDSPPTRSGAKIPVRPVQLIILIPLLSWGRDDSWWMANASTHCASKGMIWRSTKYDGFRRRENIFCWDSTANLGLSLEMPFTPRGALLRRNTLPVKMGWRGPW